MTQKQQGASNRAGSAIPAAIVVYYRRAMGFADTKKENKVEQLKQMTMAVFAVFGRLFAFRALMAQGAGGNFNFRRVFGALFLSAILGIGNVAFASTQGWVGIHHAAKADDWKKIQSLLGRGVGVDVRTNNDKKETPLHLAAWFGSVKSIPALVKAGADIDAKNHHGYTPVRLALENGQVDAARALASAGADVKTFTNTATGGYARTYLHFAAKGNQPKYIKALVALGAQINWQDNEGMTPLHVAALHNSPDAARALLELGADVGVKTNKGDYASWLADRHGSDSKIRKMLQKPMEAHERRVAERERRECEAWNKKELENLSGCRRDTDPLLKWVCNWKHGVKNC